MHREGDGCVFCGCTLFFLIVNPALGLILLCSWIGLGCPW